MDGKSSNGNLAPSTIFNVVTPTFPVTERVSRSPVALDCEPAPASEAACHALSPPGRGWPIGRVRGRRGLSPHALFPDESGLDGPGLGLWVRPCPSPPASRDPLPGGEREGRGRPELVGRSVRGWYRLFRIAGGSISIVAGWDRRDRPRLSLRRDFCISGLKGPVPKAQVGAKPGGRLPPTRLGSERAVPPPCPSGNGPFRPGSKPMMTHETQACASLRPGL